MEMGEVSLCSGFMEGGRERLLVGIADFLLACGGGDTEDLVIIGDRFGRGLVICKLLGRIDLHIF